MACWKLRWMLLLALLPSVAQAQDVFAGGAPPSETTSDAFSSSCIQAQQPNIWKQLGVNPLTCHPQTMGQDALGQCTLKGATLVSHQGTTCYYCEPQVPAGTLYIPMDLVQAVSVRGYTCGESPVDPGCMAVCMPQPGTTVTVPPPVEQTTDGGGGAPLTGSYDPCEPNYDMSTAAGRAAAQANAAKDGAACLEERCKHNPQLTGCSTAVTLQASIPATETTQATQTTAAQMEQCICGQLVDLPPGSIGPILPVNYPPANAGCAGKPLKSLAKWTPAQATILAQAVKGAIAMLQQAKVYTDKNPWDANTQDLGNTFLGNSSAATQSQTRDDVNGALQLAQSIKNVADYIFPGDASVLPPPPKGQIYAAYTNRLATPPGEAMIFILPSFWQETPAQQAFTIVHELSHLTEGGAKRDVVYGQTKCQNLASSASADPVGKLLVPLLFPDLPPTTPETPMENADSFAFFVNYVANQKK
jgi:hypothetical protein